MLELSYLATRGPIRARAPRREVIDRLRRKITVLPLDARATEEAAHRLIKGTTRVNPLELAMLGALEVNGCDELFTLEAAIDWGKWKFKITHVGKRNSR